MSEGFRYSAEELSRMQDSLKYRLQNDSVITNRELGWINLLWITDRIDLGLQRTAAKLVAHQLSQQPELGVFESVVPVPMMGLPFATTLSEELRLPLIMSRKSTHTPQTWKHPIVIGTKPYLNGNGVAHHAYNVGPGEFVLLADDVLGEADTIAPVIENLRVRGVQINCAAFYVIKHYRPGYERLKEMGVRPIGAINIKSISPEGKFELI